MTALGGLPVYLDLVHVLGLNKSMTEHLSLRKESQGWTDSQSVSQSGCHLLTHAESGWRRYRLRIGVGFMS
ncbi:MAG: hypothetical protein IME96_13300 [Proteobacteria bacterium]|nr:hypothetical protein [Pseudomonadota bacterium]